MRKIIIIFILLSFIRLNAQTDKKYILKVNLGYNSVSKDLLELDNGNWYQYYFGEIKNELKLDLNIGRKFRSSFYFGAGFQYNTSVQELNPEGEVPDTSVNGFRYLSNFTNTVITDKTISPYISIEYFKPLTDHFTIAINAFVKYDFNKNSTKNTLYSRAVLGQPFVFTNEYFKETNLQRLGFGIRPSLRYNIFKSAGLEFTFGLLQYSNKIRDSRMEDLDQKSGTFSIGFGPENWLVGFYLKI